MGSAHALIRARREPTRRGGGGGDAATAPGMPGAPEAGRGKKDLPLEPSGQLPTSTLVLHPALQNHEGTCSCLKPPSSWPLVLVPENRCHPLELGSCTGFCYIPGPQSPRAWDTGLSQGEGALLRVAEGECDLVGQTVVGGSHLNTTGTGGGGHRGEWGGGGAEPSPQGPSSSPAAYT